MTTSDMLINRFYRKSFTSINNLILVSAILVPLAGCTGGDGDAGPMLSSQATPTDSAADPNTGPTRDSTPDLTPEDPGLGGEEPMSPQLLAEEAETNSSAEQPPDSNTSASEQADVTATPATPPQGDPTISMASTVTGATASLSWQADTDSKVNGYYVYYGKQSSGESGLCSYDDRISADAPPVTIAELEPNTPYFFAVSAYKDFESACSNEVTAITPPAGT